MQTRRLRPVAAAVVALLMLSGCAAESESSPTPTPTVSAEANQINADGPDSFLTTGWQLHTDILSPFEDRIQTDPSTTNLDDRGVALYKHYQTGEELYHPIYIAQHAMALILQFQKTGDPAALESAAKNAQYLVDTHIDYEGAWFFQYEFDWTYLDRTLVAPWWSGMAQGESLTVFSLLAQLQPENTQWREAADLVFKSFSVRGSGNKQPWATVVVEGQLWFEEYAGSQPPLQVLNGQVFAIFGLWEYWRLTGDVQAARYIDGGATTVLQIMPRIRNKDGVSYYCAQLNYCATADWMNPTYHPIHIQQLNALGRITGDPRFTAWAELLLKDKDPGTITAG